MIKKANGTFVFKDTETLVLYSFANVDTTWAFDALRAIQAQITQVDTQNIFGVLESVKTISTT